MVMKLPFPLLIRGLGQWGRSRKRVRNYQKENNDRKNENKALVNENKMCTYCGIEDPR
jgi:hypothetical protein